MVVHKSGDIHSSMRKKQFISDHDNTHWYMTESFDRDIVEGTSLIDTKYVYDFMPLLYL